MWINILVGVLSFGAGMLCLDYMNAFKEENDLKKIKDDKDFDLKVRTIAYREVNERMDRHKELLNVNYKCVKNNRTLRCYGEHDEK